MKLLLIALALLILFPAELTGQEQRTLRLVVQQNGLALVSELRPMTLPRGEGAVLMPNLPASIDPQSLQVRSKTAPDALAILDLTLDDDLLTPATLLRRHIGKKVTLILPDGKTKEGRIQKEATILSTDEAPLFLIDGAVYAGPFEAIIYSELPKGLASKPRLTLTVENSGPVKQDLDLTYLAREISWRMDYVLSMNKAATSGLLSGWATLTNHSGADFPNAAVELLAGEPRSVGQFTPRAMFAADALGAAKSLTATGSEEFFEYHLYRLKRPVSLANQQSRQVRLFESASIPVTQRLLGRASALPSGGQADPLKQNLDVLVSFRNVQALALGLPLPKGTLRAYQEDGGARRFLGEAPVERTPVGSTTELRLGQVFDLSVERVVTQFEKTGERSFRAAWELRIRNAGTKTRQIVLQEQAPGKWKVESASQKWTKPSAGVLEFVVDVPPTTDKAPHLLTYCFSTEL